MSFKVKYKKIKTTYEDIEDSFMRLQVYTRKQFYLGLNPENIGYVNESLSHIAKDITKYAYLRQQYRPGFWGRKFNTHKLEAADEHVQRIEAHCKKLWHYTAERGDAPVNRLNTTFYLLEFNANV